MSECVLLTPSIDAQNEVTYGVIFLGQRVNVNFGRSGGNQRIRRSDPDVRCSSCLPIICSIGGTSIETYSTIMPTPRRLVLELRLEVCSHG